MRIRKQQARGNAGGESSGVNPGPGSQDQELVQSSRGVKEKPGDEVQMNSAAEVVEIEERLEEGSGAGQVRAGIERADSTSRSQFTWLDKLRHSKGFTELEPYSNLEDYVSSLSKKDGGSSSKERSLSTEEVVEGRDLSRLVGGTNLNAQQLARYGSVGSELSSRQASAGGLEGILSPALFLCEDSSNIGFHVHAQLQSDASLPNALGSRWSAVERTKDGGNVLPAKSSDASGMPSYDACKEPEDLELLLGKKAKQHVERRLPYMESSYYWGQARNTSWMLHNFEPSEIEKGHAESSGKKDCAGTNFQKALHYEIKSGTMEGPCTDISLRLSTVEAGPFEQGHVSSIAEPAETRFRDPLPQNDQSQGPTKTLQRRSDRNRRISSFTDANIWQLPPAAAMAETSPSLSPDHPALQPKESLSFSLYTVCMRAGKTGLTAREAMSDIMQLGLAGLEEGAVQSSRRIAKLLRNSPYYMEIGEGKFALCSAVIDTQQNMVGEGSPPNLQDEDSLQVTKQSESSTADDSKTSAGSEDKAATIRQKRKRNRVAQVREASEPETEVKSRPVRSGRPKKLKYMKQENAEELGNQCNRTDGKGWICPLLAKPGYQLCDHHLDKLRCKPGSRSKKKKKLAAALADEAEATHTREEPHLVDTAGHEFTTPVDRLTGLGDPHEVHSD